MVIWVSNTRVPRCFQGMLELVLGAHFHFHPPRRLCDRWQAQAMEDLGEDATLSAETQALLTLKGFLLAQLSEATMESL